MSNFIKKSKLIAIVLAVMLCFGLLTACDNGQKYVLNLSQEGVGTITGSGSFASGTQVTVAATPGVGYDFEGWYKDSTRLSTATQYSFTMPNSDLLLVAKFEPASYLVSVEYNNVRGTISGSGNYSFGSTVTLSATANFAYSFVGWYEDGVLQSNDITYSFIMPTRSMTLTASFSMWPTILVDIVGSGTITGFGYREPGSTVTLKATPSSDSWEFEGWYLNGVKVSSDATFYYMMPSHDVDFVAKFEQIRFALLVTKEGSGASGGSFTVTGYLGWGGTGIYSCRKGATITIKAGLSNIFPFSRMVITIDGTETTITSDTYTFTMPADDISIQMWFGYRNPY